MSLTLNRILKQALCFSHRGDDDGRKEFRERDTDRDREREKEKERRQREKERIRRQDEDRRRRRERQDGENSCRKRDDEGKKERERPFEKKRGENHVDSAHTERPEKLARDKREESNKRERMRNKVTTPVLVVNLQFFGFFVFLIVFVCASGPPRYPAVPARGQDPHSTCRRRRIQLRRQEARHRDQESGRQGRRLSTFCTCGILSLVTRGDQ